jgi:DNA-binding CsgD family transcriptional regulator/PAS domain-containing protein
MNANQLPALLELIETAALDESQWPLVLRGVAQVVGSANASLVRQDYATGRAQAIETGLDPDARRLFVAHFSARNPLRLYTEIDEAFGRRAVTVPVRAREALLCSEYYNDFLNRFDMGQLAWMFLDRDGSTVAMLNVGRPRRRDAFETRDMGLLTDLMHPLMRSYAISRRLGGFGAARGALAQYLDLQPHGVVLLDAFGRIMHANRAAWAMATAADGIIFTRLGLIAASAEADQRLQAAIARAADPHPRPRRGRCLALPRPSDARPLAVSVCPFGDDEAPLVFGRPSVLVEIRDLARPDPPADAWLAECLDLTPTEARVAGLLLAGHDRAAIAERLSIAGNTARVHIARLMHKTETHRQTELVQLLARVASLRRPGVAS